MKLGKEFKIRNKVVLMLIILVCSLLINLDEAKKFKRNSKIKNSRRHKSGLKNKNTVAQKTDNYYDKIKQYLWDKITKAEVVYKIKLVTSENKLPSCSYPLTLVTEISNTN